MDSVMTVERIDDKGGFKRLVLFLNVLAGLCIFASVMSIPDLRETRALATGGVSTTGTLTKITAPSRHIGASFQYAFKVNGDYYSGGGADWSATQTGTYTKARVGDSVLVSYLGKSPSTNKPGSPGEGLGLGYVMVFFLVVVGLSSAAASFVLNKREKR
jgi:hypothetical protein